MSREFDRRRSAPRAMFLLALAGAPLAAMAPSFAQDISGEGRASSTAVVLPLPPYPPPISGFDESDGPTSAPRTGIAKKTPETLSRAPVPAPELRTDPSPAPAEAKERSAPAGTAASSPTASSSTAPSTAAPSTAAPSPAAPLAVENPADASRAAFAKASESAFFPRLGKAERGAITEFYEARGFAPLWHEDGAATKAAASLIERMAHAGEEGLDPDDYAAGATPPASNEAKDVAEADWRLSAALVSYARDARGARIVPSRISGLITPKLSLPDASIVLETVSRASDPSSALEAFNPRAEGYVNLRTALLALRAKTGARSAANSNSTGSTELASVERRGAAVDQGAARPLSALSSRRVEADIIANMERWRWLPPDLGERYILVNVPEFTLRYVNNGMLVHEARVIVGKPTSPTPLFSADMKFLVVNPSWNVPPSILKKEFLPKLAEDPLYAERQGYEVVQHGDHISIRQPPGERNALGRIKFMFPNDHAVYLHDTPTRNLFAQSERAFSHGCVRVEQPFKLAEYVMNDTIAWPQRRMEKMVGGGERTINLTQVLPVHLAYFTLAADDQGRLRRFVDLYGLDARLEAMLTAKK
ncbi:MAG: L,D-transpeptidase family protein [Hyphomicrobiales bacterium]|nr:L,D-transpeptidase family protein [Hyphomicrobiales bacterium]